MLPNTVDDFMDLARQRNGLNSDRALARALNVTAATTNGWRLKRTWPKDAHMEQLAELCGVSVDYALMELNAWRTSGTVRNAYERLAEKIAATAAAAVLAVGLAAPGSGQAQVVNKVTSAPDTLYIMNNWILSFLAKSKRAALQYLVSPHKVNYAIS